MSAPTESTAESRILTVPNLITLLRLACLPLFVWLLLGRENPLAAGALLGVLGATDWVDGWYARRFNAISNLGKIFDPVVDRLLFFVSIVAIIIAGSAPLWFCVAVLAR
ncbi:MAG: CDP-alcohol phosphatidyltransferase family protein, partial [Actinobacteria bacterium]|nr:CDP-alcohol phosphatidyltransferase family protein [Actinomycetota bacterium]